MIVSNGFRDVDPRREAQERQDFLNGSAPVEVAGLSSLVTTPRSGPACWSLGTRRSGCGPSWAA